MPADHARVTTEVDITVSIKGHDLNAARVTALLEKALRDEIAQIPDEQRADSGLRMEFKTKSLADKGMDDFDDQHQEYLGLRQHELMLRDTRPLRVKVTVK